MIGNIKVFSKKSMNLQNITINILFYLDLNEMVPIILSIVVKNVKIIGMETFRIRFASMSYTKKFPFDFSI
jgi:hypothetical protein